VRILTDERIPEIISFVTSDIVQKRRHPNENATIIEVEGAPARRIPKALLLGTAGITQHGDPFYTIAHLSIFTEQDIVMVPKPECHNDLTLNDLFLEIIENNKTSAILYIVILLSLPLRDVLMPRLIGSLYDSIKNGKAIEYILGGILAIIVILQIIGVVSDYIDVKIHPSIYKIVREKMMAHLFKVKEENYSDVDIGNIIAKIVKLPSVLHNHIDNIRLRIIPSVITLIFILGYMFYLDYSLAIPLLVVLCIFIATIVYSDTNCSPIALKRDETFALIMSNTDDVLRNMITVLSFDNVDKEFERLDKVQGDYAAHTENTMYCSLLTKYINIPCILAFIVFSCYYSYYKVKSKAITSGTFISIVIISFMIMNILLSFLDAWQHILMRKGIIENSLSVFEECKVKREPYTKPATNTKGISFQDIEFSYITNDTNRPVLKEFNLDINLYEKTLIVGEIGSGKSTIISLLLKYQTPQKGEIFLKGVPYSTIPSATVRKNICYIPQSPILLNRTVYDNIVYGISPAPSKETVAKLITDMRLGRFLNGLPKGLDTPVGIHGSKLSGGQRQITWVLKAILTNPEIIIMDEPTSAVDDETKGIIHFLLEKVMQGKTVIMITHDPYLLKFANRVIKMKDGKLVE
jgi:ABC-type multidrug transport system fused ATPase/permease subunit